MSGANLSIWGSVPEGRERFSDESKERQCYFISRSPRCCPVSTCNASCGIEIYNLPNEANKTSELPREVNKLNSNFPNEKDETSELPCEAN